MRLHTSLVFLCWLAELLCCGAASPCATSPPTSPAGPAVHMRDEILSGVQSHLSEGKKAGMYQQPHRREPGHQLVMISAQDSPCGGVNLPSWYIQFQVAGARPVDVFNVIADPLTQPHWLCQGCTITLVKNDVHEKVQGFAGAYRSPPVNRREFYTWQAYDVDLVNEEFTVAADATGSEGLQQMHAPEGDVTVGRMCYAFSHIKRDAQGITTVTQMSQFDPKAPFAFGPFTLRGMYGTVWPLMLHRVPKIILQAQTQARAGWASNRLIIPEQFLNLNTSAAALKLYEMPKAGTVASSPDIQDAGHQESGKMIAVAIAAVCALILCCCSLCLCTYCGAFSRCCPGLVFKRKRHHWYHGFSEEPNEGDDGQARELSRHNSAEEDVEENAASFSTLMVEWLGSGAQNAADDDIE